MNSKERIKSILSFEIPDRIGTNDEYWLTTQDRWYKEGLPENISADDYFETEIRGISFDWSFRFEEKVLEETKDYRICRNKDGVTQKTLKKPDGYTPFWMDHVIKTEEDWYRFKDRLFVSEERVDWPEVLDKYRKYNEEGKFIVFSTFFPYEATWPRLGQERILTWMMQKPELIKDMFSTHTELVIGMCEVMMSKGLKFDGAFLAGDMAYRNGLLFSPRMYRELLFPFHKKIGDYFKRNNMPLIYHGCGNITEVIPLLIEAGITCLQPLEVKAGLDVRDLKKQYAGQVVFMGNIDVRVLSKTKKDIEDEIKKKIPVAKAGGGYIYHSDHSVPSNVSFENYKFTMELVKEYGRY